MIASTYGGVELSLKFAPLITIAVCVFSIVEGVIDETVGNGSVIPVKLAPDTAGKTAGNLPSGKVPAVSLAADMSVPNFALVTLISLTFAVSTASFANLAEVTNPSCY